MTMRTTLREDYFHWLYDRVGSKHHRYKLLCRELHRKRFRWHIHNDDNRCEDGINLRDIFAEERDLDEDHLEMRYFFKGDCTVFELLVALAHRMNELMFDLAEQKDRSPKWFHEMLLNLGLNVFIDNYNLGRKFDPVTEAKIDDILEVLMDRTYDFYGRGGLFPLKKRPLKDQTQVEIWYQLMLYLNENYG